MGCAAGLRSPTAAVTFASITMAAIGLAAGLAPTRTSRPASSRERRAGPWLLAAGLWAGAALGATTAPAWRDACTSALRSGATVEALGVLASRSGPAGRGRLRLRLADVELRSGRRTCRVPALLARADPGPGSTQPRPGRTVRVVGTWTRFPRASAWPVDPGRHGLLTGRVEPAAGATVEREVAARAWIRALRLRAADRLASRLPMDVAPSALALLLAERDEIDPALRRRFAEAGLAHLLAISGMHVGLLAAGALWILGLRLGVRSRTLVALLLMAGYVVLIGAPPAARRALSVFACYTWARIRGWPVRAGELLGAALLVATVSAPRSLVDPGLQLSFAGFAGVVAGRRAVDRLPVRFARRRGAGALGAGAGALIATLPITAHHFGQATPVALVSHLVGGPLVAAALGSLVATIVLPETLAWPASDLATGALRALHATAETFARLPGGHRAVPAPSAAGWIAWCLVLVGLGRFLRSGRAVPAAIPVALAAAALIAAPLAGRPTRGRALLCTLSVGQGDAAVFRSASGRWLVFDGGPAWREGNAGVAIVAPFLRREGARQVDVAVLSHPDLDHLGGLSGLLAQLPVDRVLDSGDAVPSVAYARFLAEVERTGVRWLPAAAGDRLRFPDGELLVLGPRPATRGGPAAPARGSTNATSLSVRLTLPGGFAYLNTGDATAAEEAELLAAWPAESLRADLLKVGHHGSRTSSSPAFLAAVRPRLAVISSGAGNRYGHPHPSVLARLDSMEVPRVWRTATQGTLCLEIDRDGRWRVRGEREWQPVSSAHWGAGRKRPPA